MDSEICYNGGMKAHDFPDVYKWLGLNLNTLGCVMLDLEPLTVGHWLAQDGATSYQQILPLHKSPNAERFWIDGWVADKVPHMTLLYGLLEQGKNFEPHITEVLRGWKLDEVEIEDIGFFESPYADEKYWCIVAHLKVTPELMEGHQRLEFLPHVNTFTGYKPHMTLCYLQPIEAAQRDSFIEDFRKEWKGKKIKVSDKINLGGNK